MNKELEKVCKESLNKLLDTKYKLGLAERNVYTYYFQRGFEAAIEQHEKEVKKWRDECSQLQHKELETAWALQKLIGKSRVLVQEMEAQLGRIDQWARDNNLTAAGLEVPLSRIEEVLGGFDDSI